VSVEALRSDGCVIVEDVIDEALREQIREGLHLGLADVQTTVGAEALARAGELGVVRAPMLAHPAFFRLLEIPAILDIVDAFLSPSAILHLQNGFVLPAAQPEDDAKFQRLFHRDFSRVLNGYVCSVNALLAIDDFTAANGATRVVPGSHQRAEPPDAAWLEQHAMAAECAAGSMIVFDSTLWHAAGRNTTPDVRCAVNHQFTHSFFKQQLDYVRCLGDAAVEAQAPRTQQLLGWYTRVPDSLEQFYREDRVYRAGQG
jgi:ectoine hydroxylase-related dioxygenase (phytanoyl-CoA dioxygenase family)